MHLRCIRLVQCQWRLVCILFAILRLVAPEFFSICDWNRVFSLLRMVDPSPILWEGEGVGALTSHAALPSTVDALLRRSDGLPPGAIPGPWTFRRQRDPMHLRRLLS